MAGPGGFARIGGPPGGGGQARSAKIPGSAGEPRRAGRVPRPNPRVAAATHALHGPPAPQPARPARPGGPAKPAGQPKSTPYVHWLGTTFGFNRGEGQGIEGLLNSSEAARNKSELAPLQQKGREINNQEGTANRLYGASTANMNSLLGGLVNQSEGSAKTFENTAAENAVAATKSVETAGQNAVTATGGELNPELRNILQGVGNRATGLAQGGVARAGELGQANTNYMRQLAAAAAIGAGTGPGGGLAQIANRYQTQAGQNRAAENQVLARSAARGKEERLNFPKEILTSKLAQGRFANEGIKINQGQEKIATTQRGQNITAATARRGQNLTHEAAEKKRKEDAHWKSVDARIKEGQLNVNQLNANDKRALQRYRISHGLVTGGKGESAKEGRGYVSKVSSAVAQIQRYPHTAKGRAEARAFLSAGNKEEGISAYSNDAINAAMDVVEKGYFSPGSRKAAEAQGVNSKNVGHNWFR